jgi:hypothetical protein
MRNGNVAYAFLYGFLYILALALIIALGGYLSRLKSRKPGRKRNKCKPVIRSQIQPQNAHARNTPARADAFRSVVQTISVVRTGATRVGNQVNQIQRVSRLISPIHQRVTQRIFKPPILFHGVPNPPRRVAVRNENLIEIYILEQGPQARQVTWNVGGQRIDLKKFELSFPYIDFRFAFYQEFFDSLFLFYRSSPANGSPDTRFYPSNLCNVAGNGKVCLGNGIQETLSRFVGLSKDKQIEHILNFFWVGSAFDLSHMPDANFLPWASIEPQLKTLEEWEKSTLRNPVFILSINWERRGFWFTLDQLLNPFFETGG